MSRRRSPPLEILSSSGPCSRCTSSPPGSRYLIRLPGCDLNQATLRVGVVDISGYSEGANLSAVGLHFSKPCAPSSVPDWAMLSLHRLLDYPPPCGRILSAAGLVAAPPQGSAFGSRCLASLAPLVPPLLELRDSLVGVVLPVISVTRSPPSSLFRSPPSGSPVSPHLSS